ncbi:MAG: DUF1266 domain-containing protein [Dysgonomonas sp.]
MKKLVFGALASVFLLSCGGGNSGSEGTTIEDATLQQELLGGVYIIAGYEGQLNPASDISAKPDSKGFLKEMHEYYANYFILPFKPEDGSGAKRMLSSAWGINSKEDLIKRGEGLLSEGHSKEYAEHLDFLEKNKDADLSTLFIPNELDLVLLRYLKDNYSRFEGHTMKAWDYARYVNNVNMGYSAGYITETEAKELIAKALPLAQAEYGTWDEYFDDFLLGRELWNEGPDSDYAKAVAKIKDKEDKYNIYNYVLFK